MEFQFRLCQWNFDSDYVNGISIPLDLAFEELSEHAFETGEVSCADCQALDADVHQSVCEFLFFAVFGKRNGSRYHCGAQKCVVRCCEHFVCFGVRLHAGRYIGAVSHRGVEEVAVGIREALEEHVFAPQEGFANPAGNTGSSGQNAGQNGLADAAFPVVFSVVSLFVPVEVQGSRRVVVQLGCELCVADERQEEESGGDCEEFHV